MHGRDVNTILMMVTKKDGKLEDQYESRVKHSRSQTNERVENTSFDLERYILFVRKSSIYQLAVSQVSLGRDLEILAAQPKEKNIP